MSFESMFGKRPPMETRRATDSPSGAESADPGRPDGGSESEFWTRREFLRTLVVFFGGAATFGLSGCGQEGEETAADSEIDFEHLPPDFWFRVMTKIYERFGDDPIPMQIRAHAIIKALGIPSGQASALTSTREATRTDPQTDEVIARQLTNDAGVEVLPEHIATSDILDLYPDGLPEELGHRLDPRVREMFEARYDHARAVRERYGDTQDKKVALNQEHYFRLPGGVDLLTVGYTHVKKYQKIHADYLEQISKNAEVIAIEGYSSTSYGKKLEHQYEGDGSHDGDYDKVMRRAIKSGFRGFFAEVDARDTRENWEAFIEMDREVSIPFRNDFYRTYLEYIRREHPALFAEIGSEARFRELLARQPTSTTTETDRRVIRHGRSYMDRRAVGTDLDYVPDPEGFEFGQMMFSDALSAIKLHLIGRLMADGKIAKGPIVDIQGALHLSNKSFFIRYPEYAMEVVLRTLPELLSFHGIERVVIDDLDYPDWSEVVRHIAKLAFARTTDDPDDIEPFFYDYLGAYGIDPEKVIPSDEEIGEIMERTRRGAAMRKGDEKTA
jgi:hypothetical protein